MGNAPLRRTRGDLIATAVITAVSLAAVGGVWATASVNHVEHHVAATEYEAPESDGVPTQLTEQFSLFDGSLPGSYAPLVVGGVLVVHNDHEITGVDTEGTTIWSYSRSDRPICAVGAAWGKVVVSFDAGFGCGDVVALNAATGEYDGTRSAIAQSNPVAFSSNDRVGIYGPDRVELWRSDLVRTVEYGKVEAPQEADMQPNATCTNTSALTRKELLAVTQTCPDKPDTTMLRFLDSTPEDSREPEINDEVEISAPNARLVAIGEHAAVVYVPGPQPKLITYDDEGNETSREKVAASPLIDAGEPAATADLPHHMTFFDGERLYLFQPSTLEISHVIEGARGTGAAMGNRLLVPKEGGISVVNWSTGEEDSFIPVERETPGPVSLAVAGNIVVEKRGNTVVGLRP